MLDIYIYFEYNINVMNIIDKKIRFAYLFLALVSLVAGAIIYIFFRQGTYIHLGLSQTATEKIALINKIIPDLLIIKLLKYYFVDYLWCVALNLSLLAVSDFKNKFVTMCISFISVIFGILFEISQYLDIVSGTFDFWDITMYVVASFFIAIMNIKFIKRMDLK